MAAPLRLHDLLRHVRLIRITGGVLRPSKAAADELQTVRRLRSWFDPQGSSTMVAERAVALGAFSYRVLRTLITTPADPSPAPVPPLTHANVRGGDYFH